MFSALGVETDIQHLTAAVVEFKKRHSVFGWMNLQPQVIGNDGDLWRAVENVFCENDLGGVVYSTTREVKQWAPVRSESLMDVLDADQALVFAGDNVWSLDRGRDESR